MVNLVKTLELGTYKHYAVPAFRLTTQGRTADEKR